MTTLIKEGWLLKRSKFLKQWRERWVMMTELSIGTYQNHNVETQATAEIQISTIQSITTCVEETRKEWSFKIQGEQETLYLRASNEEDMNDWITTIQQLINQLQQTVTNIQQNQRIIFEMKANTQIQVIKSFTHFKQLLRQREATLLYELQQVHITRKQEIIDVSEEIQSLICKQQENCNKIDNILNNDNMTQMDKIKQMVQLPKQRSDSNKFDNVLNTQAKFVMNEQQLDTFLRCNIKTKIQYPLEYKIRRTNITRALKWRYSGQRYDALTFSSNENIMFTGIGICRPYKPGTTIEVLEFHIVKGNQTNGTILYKHSQSIVINFQEDESVYKIQVPIPLFLRKDNKYSALLLIKGAGTFKCVECFNTIQGERGINFSFSKTCFTAGYQNNRNDAVCGPIADFYYQL